MNLKPLGIIRKIDNLGRIVIPKEIRTAQGWKEGEAMEMYMSDNKLVIQSYTKNKEIEQIVKVLEKIKNDTNNYSYKQDIEEIIKYFEQTDL